MSIDDVALWRIAVACGLRTGVSAAGRQAAEVELPPLGERSAEAAEPSGESSAEEEPSEERFEGESTRSLSLPLIVSAHRTAGCGDLGESRLCLGLCAGAEESKVRARRCGRGPPGHSMGAQRERGGGRVFGLSKNRGRSDGGMEGDTIGLNESPTFEPMRIHFPLAYLTPSLPHSLFPSFTPSSPHSCPRLLLRPPFLSPPPPPPSPRSEIMCLVKGQVTAIVTGVISLILAIGYLALVQLLDSRGLQMLPPPPEAFGP
ncbi:unnamed protein product [Closterium sp. NIES-64]|nr:unnamed protein product [Closterium sp. NIES-64]